jgi:hypothetical protein
LVGNMKSRKTERIEVVVAQCLLDRRVSGHAPVRRLRIFGQRDKLKADRSKGA